MSGKSRFAVLLLAFMLVTSMGVTYASAQTDGEYSVEAQNTIDIPDRTVTVENVNYTVTSIGKVTAGETLEATTSGPDGETFDVDLYSGDQELLNSDEGTDGSVSFSTENLRPGTYILAVHTDSGAVSPQPVVVAGYETTLNAPSELTTGESGNVSVQLDDVADLGSPENVELVITQDDEVVETVQMTNESTYEYSAQVGSSLDSGEYRMYAMVHNETTVGGDNVLGDDNDVVGVTDAQTLTVSSGGAQPQADDENGQNDDDDSDSGSSDSDSDSSSYSADNGSNDVGTSTSTAAPNGTETGTTTVAVTETSETSDEPTATTETEEIMTDSQTNAPSETGTDSSMPNFALYIVALALVAAALIARR